MKLLNINIMLILFLLSLNFVSATGGGGDVPISTISLNEPDNNYNMTSGRLKFEFEKEWYAIQLIRVKDEYADFIVMNLDKDNLEDITAYWIIEDTFSLNPSEGRRIGLNGDNIEDVVVGLDEIINGGKYGTVRFASFYIKKLTNANVMPASKENENIKETKNDEEIIESENGNVLNEESQEEVITINLAGGGKEKVMLMETQTLKEATDLTIFQKMINWFKRLF